MTPAHRLRVFVFLFSALVLAGCSSGSGNKGQDPEDNGELLSHTVTPEAGEGGSISPSTPQTVAAGEEAVFTVTPDADYQIQTVTGCAGTRTGNTYTTGPIGEDCTVTASFAPAAASYSVGGTVSGLAGNSITLSNNEADELTLTADGGFSFTELADGAAYAVTVHAQPAGQECTVSNGSGTVDGADVTDIAVTCVTTLGAAQGLWAGTGSEAVTVHWDPVSDADSYAVFWGETADIHPDVSGSWDGSADDLTATEYAITGLSNGTRYYVVVVARAGAITGPASDELAAMPAAPRFAYVANGWDDTVSTYAVDGETGRLTWIDAVAPGDNPRAVAVDPSDRYVYVANRDSGDISQYVIAADGRLSPMAEATVAAGTWPTSVAVDPLGRYVYVANNGDATVSQYTIAEDGSLAPMVPADVDVASAFSVSVDPSGRFVYVAGLTSSHARPYAIGEGGALTPLPTSWAGSNLSAAAVHPSGRYVYVPSGENVVSQFRVGPDGALNAMLPAVDAGTRPWAMAIDPSGRYAYVTNYNSDDVSQFTINGDGRLSPMDPPAVPTGAYPAGISADPSGRYLYVTNDDGVSHYVIAADGRLSPAAPATAPSHAGPIGMAMTGGAPLEAVARFAYVANRDSDDVSQYSVADGGGLEPMDPGAAVAAGNAARFVSVHPSGRYAYVVNQNGDSVSQYAVADDGSLAPLTPATESAGVSPMAIAIHPAGRYAYAVNGAEANLTRYTIDDGVLTAVGSVDVGNAPHSVSVHPSGRYAYVANSTDGTVSQYDIVDHGALTPMAPATVATGSQPRSVAIHPAGSYAYVANYGAGSLSQYGIADDGSLSPMDTPTVAAGTSPAAIALDPAGRYAYVANWGSDSVSQYIVGDDGGLSAMDPPTVAAGESPHGVTVDPSGRYVYVANWVSDTVGQYLIGDDGRLSPMTPDAAVATGTSPASVTLIGGYE